MGVRSNEGSLTGTTVPIVPVDRYNEGALLGETQDLLLNIVLAPVSRTDTEHLVRGGSTRTTTLAQ